MKTVPLHRPSQIGDRVWSRPCRVTGVVRDIRSTGVFVEYDSGSKFWTSRSNLKLLKGADDGVVGTGFAP